MTRARKFSGKTVDEATETALAELGVELEDVDIRVIRPGRSGILGFGGETAEIEISSLDENEIVLILVTPSTTWATSGPNNSCTCSIDVSVSSTTSCSNAA